VEWGICLSVVRNPIQNKFTGVFISALTAQNVIKPDILIDEDFDLSAYGVEAPNPTYSGHSAVRSASFYQR
jgi:hypothetical protein